MTNYLTSQGVQSFAITIGSGSTTATATINSVGSGAFILFNGINPSISSNPSESFASVTLTNSTTVTATRNTGTAGTITVYGCVIDGDTTNLISRIQFVSGTIANGNKNNFISITSVPSAQTAIHYLGHTSANTLFATENELFHVIPLSGGSFYTGFEVARIGNVGTVVVSFVVITFVAGALNSNVQLINATTSSSVTSYTASISSVTRANALLIFAGQDTTGTPALSEALQYGTLTSSTQITISLNTASSNIKRYDCYVVEFVSGVLNSAIQRSTTTLTGVSSNTSTITSVTPTSTALNWLGESTSGTGSDTAEGAASLTNSTTVTVSRNSSTGNLTGSWEVVEFVAPSNQGAGSASGSATVSGTGQAVVSAQGSSSGIASVSGAGISTAASMGTSTGTASVASQEGCEGLSTGNAAASAVGTTGISATGSSSGIATVTATGTTGISATGSVTGTATVTATGSAHFEGVGSAQGSAAVSAGTTATKEAAASSLSSATAVATSQIIFLAHGTSLGSADVRGVSPTPPDLAVVLAFLTSDPVNSTASFSSLTLPVTATMTNLLSLRNFLSNQKVNSTGIMSNSPVALLENF